MKTIGIIGLGKFGFQIAESLSKLNDIALIVADQDEKIVQEISEFVENAFVVDSTNKHALKEIGIFELDTVIVSIGDNLEASILTVMAVKELNNKHVIAKAFNQVHGQILSKLGVLEVIYPEKIAGKILVNRLVTDITVSEIDISNSLKIMKVLAKEKLIGKTVMDIENTYKNIKIVAIKHVNDWIINIEALRIIQDNDFIAFLGDKEFLKVLSKDM